MLIEEVRKKHEADAYILDDPIAEMQIDIPPQLLKYASYAPQKQEEENNENQNSPHRFQDQSQQKSNKKGMRTTSAKKRSGNSQTQEELAVVNRLYSAAAKREQTLEKMREEKLKREL